MNPRLLLEGDLGSGVESQLGFSHALRCQGAEIHSLQVVGPAGVFGSKAGQSRGQAGHIWGGGGGVGGQSSVP